MGKIIDALMRTEGTLSAEVLSSLGEGPVDRGGPVLEAAAGSIADIQELVGGIAESDLRLPSGIRSVPLRVSSNSPLLPFDQPGSQAAEQYRILRTKVLQHPSRPRVIVVSSAGSGDGKSTTAVNLAGSLSLKPDTSVLLLDGDLRRATLAALLGIPPAPGLAEVVSGATRLESAIVRCQQFPSLHVLPAGKLVTDPAELLESAAWKSNVASLRAMFRYIVVDSPPVGIVADFDLLRVLSDGVILVLRPDHTERPSGLKAIEAVGKEKLIGVVMNCVEDWLFSKPRYYGYPYPANTSNRL